LSKTHALPEYHDESGLYEIRLKGHLNVTLAQLEPELLAGSRFDHFI
jgi:hypothetical protein